MDRMFFSRGHRTINDTARGQLSQCSLVRREPSDRSVSTPVSCDMGARSLLQTFFYWAILIQLLCGMRPGEISQLCCLDISLLYDKWHFRFAKRSLLAEGDEDGDGTEDAADTGPGGNDAKTKNAFGGFQSIRY